MGITFHLPPALRVVCSPMISLCHHSWWSWLAWPERKDFVVSESVSRNNLSSSVISRRNAFFFLLFLRTIVTADLLLAMFSTCCHYFGHWEKKSEASPISCTARHDVTSSKQYHGAVRNTRNSMVQSKFQGFFMPIIDLFTVLEQIIQFWNNHFCTGRLYNHFPITIRDVLRSCYAPIFNRIPNLKIFQCYNCCRADSVRNDPITQFFPLYIDGWIYEIQLLTMV